MIYGLYLSAGGVMTCSHKQDVIANNLANSDVPGFKRDIPLFQQRMTEAEQRRMTGAPPRWSDPTLEKLGGGMLVMPNSPDGAAGGMEHSGNPLDVAIEGDGFFAVRQASKEAGGEPGKISLTRNGQFQLDREGYLVLGTEDAPQVLDANRQPIKMAPDGGTIAIGTDGSITQGERTVGRLGTFTVADKGKLSKAGGTLLSYPDADGLTAVTNPLLHSEFTEQSNVDPTTELTELMQVQRLLEANANMIRAQDQTLSKLVNEVGKIG